jgi:succinyl-CoA synthetase beta subunit
MRLYENEAKRVFEREAIAVPRAVGVFERAEDVGRAVGAGAPVMLKSLVLIGGRGKAGGVRRAAGGAEAGSAATRSSASSSRRPSKPWGRPTSA